MSKDESLSGFDSVKINNRAIASIAYLAATEIEGVKSLAKDYKYIFMEIIGAKNQTGIKVKFDKNNDMKIKISLVVKYGYSIPEIAAKVQENVYKALDKMTGINVKDIDINVRGVER